jgi:acyl carrier protein
MIPAAFVFLPETPVTSNGKVDRKALSIHNLKTETEERIFDAPLTETEKIVGEIWADVLGIGEISRQDDFFMLGGHSLIATQVISRIRETFDLNLPLRTLFELTTLETLAAEIDLRQKNE